MQCVQTRRGTYYALTHETRIRSKFGAAVPSVQGGPRLSLDQRLPHIQSLNYRMKSGSSSIINRYGRPTDVFSGGAAPELKRRTA